MYRKEELRSMSIETLRSVSAELKDQRNNVKAVLQEKEALQAENRSKYWVDIGGSRIRLKFKCGIARETYPPQCTDTYEVVKNDSSKSGFVFEPDTDVSVEVSLRHANKQATVKPTFNDSDVKLSLPSVVVKLVPTSQNKHYVCTVIHHYTGNW
jgi:hypothetical protein